MSRRPFGAATPAGVAPNKGKGWSGSLKDAETFADPISCRDAALAARCVQVTRGRSAASRINQWGHDPERMNAIQYTAWRDILKDFHRNKRTRLTEKQLAWAMRILKIDVLPEPEPPNVQIAPKALRPPEIDCPKCECRHPSGRHVW